MSRAQESRDDKVSLVEMGPRDGLQNEAATLSLVQRLELIARLAESGLQRIEVGAFVSPKGAADGGFRRTVQRPAAQGPTRYGALVPNLQGLQAAIAARADEIGLFTACSDGFTQANIGISVEESLVRFAPLVQEARSLGIRCALPLHRHRLPVRWPDPAQAGRRHGRATAGSGLPRDIARRHHRRRHPGTVAPCWMRCCTRSRPAGSQSISRHLWPGAGQPAAGAGRGIRTIDSSVAGLGGCPYAPAPPATSPRRRWSTCCTALA
ncbi:hydroxymethylglutaryl-CoA lyase [Aeromonas hydrophila]|uniref:hydroxymethylglutaryl-CoA lyase n=1 Tax=Aeromonas hydrophila TaxID=644 RepID=A0A926IY67_AERHY|nr:hydroxymethylglutaryl-CoA lyase [Aeromonas hydrophila]